MKQCTVDGCTSPSRKRGWCASHYSQWTRIGEVKPFSFKWAEEKKCAACGSRDWDGPGRKFCSGRCQQLWRRSGGSAPLLYKQCARCTTIIDMMKPGPSGRKRRADVEMCDACRKAKYTRHRCSVTELADRDGTACRICFEDVDMSLVYPDPFRASVDHVVPYSKGGSNDPSNLQLAHLYCNMVKLNREGFTI